MVTSACLIIDHAVARYIDGWAEPFTDSLSQRHGFLEAIYGRIILPGVKLQTREATDAPGVAVMKSRVIGGGVTRDAPLRNYSILHLYRARKIPGLVSGHDGICQRRYISGGLGLDAAMAEASQPDAEGCPNDIIFHYG